MKNIFAVLMMLVLGSVMAGLAGCAFRSPTTPMLPGSTIGSPGHDVQTEGGTVTGMVSGVLDTDMVIITAFPTDSTIVTSYTAVIMGSGDYSVVDIPPGAYWASATVFRGDLAIDQANYPEEITITEALETISNVDFAF